MTARKKTDTGQLPTDAPKRTGFPESTFTGVLVHRSNHVYVSCISDELADQNVDHAAILRWQDGVWAHRTVDVAVNGMAVVEEPKLTLLNMGVNGKIAQFTFPGENIEFVDTTDDGPSDLLHLRCMRMIRNQVYVAGMARHVYRREQPTVWKAIDSGVFVPRTERKGSTGFNSIDGLSENAIHAVGYGGEIWHYNGQMWQQQNSPTSVALTCVRYVDPKTVYAAGLAGVLLRSVNNSWETIHNTATKEDFWGMTLFQGRVYLSTYQDLFVIEGDNVLPVDMNLSRKLSTAYIDANDGVMWSVGQKDLAYTKDGITWSEVAGPI